MSFCCNVCIEITFGYGLAYSHACLGWVTGVAVGVGFLMVGYIGGGICGPYAVTFWWSPGLGSSCVVGCFRALVRGLLRSSVLERGFCVVLFASGLVWFFGFSSAFSSDGAPYVNVLPLFCEFTHSWVCFVFLFASYLPCFVEPRLCPPVHRYVQICLDLYTVISIVGLTGRLDVLPLVFYTVYIYFEHIRAALLYLFMFCYSKAWPG